MRRLLPACCFALLHCGTEAEVGSLAASQAALCGPEEAVVERVIDGDTFVLTSGERIRMLLVDTPESKDEPECFGTEARSFSQSVIEGKTVTLRYSNPCTDRFERLLAYVSIEGREVNSLLVERGYACMLFIPPAGADREPAMAALQAHARSESRGLWGACPRNPCR